MASKRQTVLQIGQMDWREMFAIPDNLNWVCMSVADFQTFAADRKAKQAMIAKIDREINLLRSHPQLSEKQQKAYIKDLEKQKPRLGRIAAIVLTDKSYSDDLLEIRDIVAAYTVFHAKETHFSTFRLRKLSRDHFFQTFDAEASEGFLHTLSKILFSGQSGGKFFANDFQLSPVFSGKASYQGLAYLKLEGHFGQEYQLLATYRYNIFYDSDSILKLWPEFIKEDSIALQFQVSLIPEGSTDQIVNSWTFEGDSLKEEFVIDAPVSGYLIFNIYAKGDGCLQLGPCHNRWSRSSYGDFVLGGKRFAGSDRREFNYFFDPGDLKPPLCVYFSGWRSAEGFEGYGMMKKMGTPFMLLCDPRLSGGAFYMGKPELEEKIATVIKEALDFLGFDHKQLILSGMSMGTFGALYYSADLDPRAIILSKPVLSLGRMALLEKRDRPGVFPTSLDLLYSWGGALTEESADKLDRRFWRKFKQATFSQTTCLVAYMKDDDYDKTAFDDLIAYSRGKNFQIIGRGWEGRHNDGYGETVSWFVQQYHNLLSKQFGRCFE